MTLFQWFASGTRRCRNPQNRLRKRFGKRLYEYIITILRRLATVNSDNFFRVNCSSFAQRQYGYPTKKQRKKPEKFLTFRRREAILSKTIE